ncbi:endonuclease/exonuclease/phosphatase family protein [Psychrobacter sp. I-STPA10]|uniref:endonuclease/exonuclease/phosphatase family protein n=1 Tax=Psychrobacter sp. I-STPA10 TaxID=2585769 RepID=UPI001E40ACC5|nr:endonuclease/exonuclease/phosphatase family protein [Psychrobacter sp. I-STPA10]
MKVLYRFFSRRLFWLAWLALIVLLLSQLFGRIYWQLELFSHYLPHVAILLLLASCFYPVHKKYLVSRQIQLGVRLGFGLLGGILLLLSLQSLSMLTQNVNPPDSTIAPLTIAYQNVNIGNQQAKQTLAQLTQFQPDVLILLEAGGENWQQPLQTLITENYYPIHCQHKDNSPFAMQVFVHQSNAHCEVIKFADFPAIKITLPNLPNQRSIYAVHPPPPINSDLAHARNQYLHALKQHLLSTNLQGNYLIIGDFNLSAFSPIYRDFIADSKLQRATPRGLPTWLPFAISIDQILIHSRQNTSSTNDINIQVQPLAWVGSDHRGFLLSWE